MPAFSLSTSDLCGHRLLSRHKFLWKEERIRSESSWLHPYKLCFILSIVKPCLECQKCSMQDTPLGVTTDDVSLPASCIAPSGIMNASQLEGSFQLSSSFISLFYPRCMMSSTIESYHTAPISS